MMTEKRPSILIVEDDNFLSTYLEDEMKEKFDARIATTATEARRALSESPANLIVLDILIPDEDGFSFLKDIKKDDSPYRDIPVIILSNLDQPEDIERGKKLGAVEYLVKANQLPNEIIKEIQTILGENP